MLVRVDIYQIQLKLSFLTQVYIQAKYYYLSNFVGKIFKFII